MAWADIAGRTTNDWITSEDWTNLADAAIERAGWVGDTTEHDAATVVKGNVEVSDWIDHDDVNSLRTSVENILGKFYQDGTFSSGSYSAWTKAVLLQHLYDNHGGTASGVRRIGAGPYTYDWLRLPSRLGTESSGALAAGDWIVYEHVRGIFFALDHLRYIVFDLNNSHVSRWQKYGTDAYPADRQDAWDAMRAASPTSDTTDSWGHNITYSPPSAMECWGWQEHLEFTYLNAPIAGHYPSGFDEGKMGFAGVSGAGYYLGPHRFYGSVTDDESANWASGTLMLEGTLTTSGNWKEFTLSSVAPLPTDGTALGVRVCTDLLESATVPANDTKTNSFQPTSTPLANAPQQILAKPTTTRGT